MLKTKRKIDGVFLLNQHKRQDSNFAVSSSHIQIQKQILHPGKIFLYRLGLILPRNWYISTMIFGMGALTLVFLFSGVQVAERGHRLSQQILGAATSSFENFQSGDLALAQQNLEQLIPELQSANQTLVSLLAMTGIGVSTSELTRAAEGLLEVSEELQGVVPDLLSLRFLWNSETKTSGQELFATLQTTRTELVKNLDKLRVVQKIIAKVNPAFFPAERKSQFQMSQTKLLTGIRILEESVVLQSLFLNLLGGEEKTYLLIFQNNNEARATGGFPGTYGLLNFRNGTVNLERIESIYALDGQLKEKIAAPGPLQRQATEEWALRDSNWFVDFPTSARKMLNFLELESEILADGVIALTPDVFERLLKITGPVEMPEYGVVLTAENFRETVQQKTSYEYDRELNQPKKFLSDFAFLILGKIAALQDQSGTKFFQELALLSVEKHLMIFSFDPQTQAYIRELRIDGAIWPTAGDYLAVYHSNVGGGKTDQDITQSIQKQVTIASDGLAIVRLSIKRKHQGFSEKYFPKNVDFMRVLVPSEARLLSARGFDDFELLPSRREGAKTDSDLANWDKQFVRDESHQMYVGWESGYKVFSNWLELNPGDEKTVELVYEIPFATSASYSHFLQKQPGAREFDFRLEVRFLSRTPTVLYPPAFVKDRDSYVLQESVNSDRYSWIVAK